VAGLSGVLHIGAGTAHGCARRATREVLCWGNNTTFQLGNAASGNSAIPLVVNGL
jgi:alpha-tubulin suppressor-like RCC1 family protein